MEIILPILESYSIVHMDYSNHLHPIKNLFERVHVYDFTFEAKKNNSPNGLIGQQYDKELMMKFVR